MPEAGKKLQMIAGLGNPGDDYAMTRHNSGFMTLDHIVESFSIPLIHKKFDTLYGRGRIENAEVILAKPMAFMNQCGPPLKMIADYLEKEDMEFLRSTKCQEFDYYLNIRTASYLGIKLPDDIINNSKKVVD